MTGFANQVAHRGTERTCQDIGEPERQYGVLLESSAANATTPIVAPKMRDGLGIAEVEPLGQEIADRRAEANVNRIAAQ